MQYDISVSGHEFKVTNSKNQLIVNDQSIDPEITKVSENEWLVHLKDKCFHVVKSENDKTGKSFYVNGKLLELKIKTELDHILDKLGMDLDEGTVLNEIAAPMPGAILEILVVPGQEVKAGDKLIVLEAMKMENIIKSPADGKVSSVPVNVGENVEKGQPLITF